MLRLLKYELRKTLLSKLILLAVTLVAEAVFLVGLWGGRDNSLAIGAVLLFFIAITGIAMMGILSVATLHKDMNTRQGYMLFMTPNSCYKILGAKVLENGLSMLVTGAFFFGLGALDIMLLFAKFSTVGELWKFLEDFIHSINNEMACFFLNLLTGWFSVVIMAYLADVISAALLNGKKYNGLLSFVLFLALTIALRVLEKLTVSALVPQGTGINTVYLVRSAATLVFSAVMYVCTAQIMERKLSV